jgi:hypothetical protein
LASGSFFIEGEFYPQISQISADFFGEQERDFVLARAENDFGFAEDPLAAKTGGNAEAPIPLLRSPCSLRLEV